jgi:hypothetical protein
MRSKELTTNATACGSVIQNRVIRRSVIGSSSPRSASPRKNGMTLPREPITLP